MPVIIFENYGKITQTPVPEGTDAMQEALKITPYEQPFLIVGSEDLPDFAQESWEADFSNPHGHGLGAQRYFIQQAEAEIEALQALPESEERDAAIAHQQAIIATQEAELEAMA